MHDNLCDLKIGRPSFKSRHEKKELTNMGVDAVAADQKGLYMRILGYLTEFGLIELFQIPKMLKLPSFF